MKVLAPLALAQAARAAYVLSESYVSRDFFSKWDFWSSSDPSKGFVEYVDQATATELGLVRATEHGIYVGVDSTSKSAGEGGRRSVRIQSKAVYNRGLFVASFDHVPTGCGTWPAFWMYGEDADHTWPKWGEYDIIEGVHDANETMTSLHTGANCSQAGVREGRDFAGGWKRGLGAAADNCDIRAPDQWRNQGCSQRGPSASMGQGFNAGGGGTYAAEWDPDAGHFRTWFWPKGAEPEDVASGRPSPESWPLPFSFFSLDPEVCEPRHFDNMRLVFDITFCGDLGDPTFAESCGAAAGGLSCKDFVATHPEAMRDAYWSIRSLDVYLPGGVAASTTEAPVPVLPPAGARPPRRRRKSDPEDDAVPAERGAGRSPPRRPGKGRSPPHRPGAPEHERRREPAQEDDGFWTPTMALVAFFWLALVSLGLCLKVWQKVHGESSMDVRCLIPHCDAPPSKSPAFISLVDEEPWLPSAERGISAHSWPLPTPAAAFLGYWTPRAAGGADLQFHDDVECPPLPEPAPSSGAPSPRSPGSPGSLRPLFARTSPPASPRRQQQQRHEQSPSRPHSPRQAPQACLGQGLSCGPRAARQPPVSPAASRCTSRGSTGQTALMRL